MRGRPALGLPGVLGHFRSSEPHKLGFLSPLVWGGDLPGAPWELVAGEEWTVSHQRLHSPQSTVSRGPGEAAAHHAPRGQAGHQVETSSHAPRVSSLACGWLIHVCHSGHGDVEAPFLPGTLPRDPQLTICGWGPQPPLTGCPGATYPLPTAGPREKSGLSRP